MARYHATPNGNIPFTPEEEAEQDAIEQAWNEGALDRAKEAKRLEMKQARDNDIAQPINNVQVATLEDRENIQGAITNFEALKDENNQVVWTMADNTEQALTLVDLQGVYSAYIRRKALAFQNYQVKKTEIESATLEIIQGINW